MTEIILHVGMHRTGSTSIQSALRGYDDGKTLWAELGFENHSIPFYTAFSELYQSYPLWLSMGLSEKQVTEKRKFFRSEILRIAKTEGRERIIFSGEDICSLTKEEFVDMLSLFDESANSVSVYFYVRRPLEFIKSDTQHAIKAGAVRNSLWKPDYGEKFRKIFETLEQDRIHFRLFDPVQLKHGDVVEDFCQWLGLEKPIEFDVVENASISTTTAKLLSHINRSNILLFGDPVLNSAHGRLVDVLQSTFPGKFDLHDELLVGAVDPEDIRWMEDASGISFGLNLDRWRIGMHPRDFASYIFDVASADVDRLIGLLKERGVDNEYNRDCSKLVTRLFYTCFSEEMSDAGSRDKFSFDADRYLRLNPDVRKAGVDPYKHYLLHGYREGRRF